MSLLTRDRRRLSVAPMMACTDRHFRYLLRLITRETLLYTEMINTGAILHGDQSRCLTFNEIEHPLVLQLGGNSPRDFAVCAKIAQNWGYDELNLNIGCPSPAVQKGAFGVTLMRQKELVAQCLEQITSATTLPVSVKTRIGVDDDDSYEFLAEFINALYEAGCRYVIIHARKALLKGLNPKKNREIPPLIYERAYRIKRDFPNLHLTINGGIKYINEIEEHLQSVDGVMIGRHFYEDPYFFHNIDMLLHEKPKSKKSQVDIVREFIPYLEEQINQGVPCYAVTRHLLNLFRGEKGARLWRRAISENSIKAGVGHHVVSEALKHVEEE